MKKNETNLKTKHLLEDSDGYFACFSNVGTNRKNNEDIAYSTYGSPIESTTFKFAKCLQKRFGIIKDVTDHDYITNSYHINVREHIDPFEKLKIESEYQKLSPGG